MPDKRARRIAIAALIQVIAGCSAPPAEQRLRDTIAAMEQAIEAQRPADFVAHVAEDFTGGDGQLDRTQLRGFLAAQMVGSETIEVVLGPIELTMQGDRATVKTSALVVGGRYLPERGEQVDIVSGWRLEDGEWVCINARWTSGR
jgi:hypothetical protein